jgi:predicted cobalt transporter CbtA
VAAFWAVGFVPFLKYPANPPGVGEPDTIAYRQMLYLAILALSAVGTVAAIAAGHVIGRSHASSLWRWLPAIGLALIVGAVLYAAMPANPDPVRLPAELIQGFRIRSLAGMALFWAVFGVAFAVLAGRASAPLTRPVLNASDIGR